MTRQEAVAFRERWAAVNAAQEEENRSTPISEKLDQLSALMVSAASFGWKDLSDLEEDQVRERWSLLRRRWCV
jgi:hypothetical protein